MNDNTQNLSLAPLIKRFVAFVIDDLLISFMVFYIFWEEISKNASNMEAMVVVVNSFVVPIILLKIIYQTFFVWYFGATIGKIIMKIKVIDYYTYQKVSFLSSLFRGAGRVISEMFFYLGFLFALSNKAKQSFHDKISKTLVVNV